MFAFNACAQRLSGKNRLQIVNFFFKAYRIRGVPKFHKQPLAHRIVHL